jgi:hypothetical protein
MQSKCKKMGLAPLPMQWCPFADRLHCIGNTVEAQKNRAGPIANAVVPPSPIDCTASGMQWKRKKMGLSPIANAVVPHCRSTGLHRECSGSAKKWG